MADALRRESSILNTLDGADSRARVTAEAHKPESGRADAFYPSRKAMSEQSDCLLLSGM